ncbi:hypothetical protein FQR65_LT18284 [Abscondita terminalis]|nr:hypothetical protein FQR65_LT18284 [Abscondita terminalis]
MTNLGDMTTYPSIFVLLKDSLVTDNLEDDENETFLDDDIILIDNDIQNSLDCENNTEKINSLSESESEDDDLRTISGDLISGGELNLKDFSNELSDFRYKKAPFLKVKTPSGKVLIVKKKSLVWFLSESKDRISTDRLLRVRCKNVTQQETALEDVKTQSFVIEREKYYSVFYDEQWYIGRIIKIFSNTVEMKFLKEELHTFFWGKITDIQRATHGPTPQYDFVECDKIEYNLIVYFYFTTESVRFDRRQTSQSAAVQHCCSSRLFDRVLVLAIRFETFLREFFDMYKDQECLWKIKSSSYHDKNVRKRAMDILVAKFQEVKADANEEFVKKKINNFRTSYKRELKLVKNSSKWLLSFLGDQDLPRTPVSNMSDEEEITDQESTHSEHVLSPTALENEDSQISEHSILSTGTSTYSKTPSGCKKRGRKTDPRDDLLITINERLNRPKADGHEKDRFHVYGDNVAIRLRALPTDQKIMAEKLINDVLFEAECNTLNRQWRLQPPSTHASIPYIPQRNDNVTVTAASNSIFQSRSNGTSTTRNYTELRPPQYVNSYPSYSASQLFETFDANDNN